MTKSYVFQPGDVGMLGMLFMYGIWGVMFYAATTYAACRSWRFMPRLGLSPSIAEGLGLTGAVVTVFSLLAPTFAGGSGSAFGALFISFLCLQGNIALESLTRKRRAWEFAPRR
jgi:hypothetical protein